MQAAPGIQRIVFFLLFQALGKSNVPSTTRCMPPLFGGRLCSPFLSGRRAGGRLAEGPAHPYALFGHREPTGSVVPRNRGRPEPPSPRILATPLRAYSTDGNNNNERFHFFQVVLFLTSPPPSPPAPSNLDHLLPPPPPPPPPPRLRPPPPPPPPPPSGAAERDPGSPSPPSPRAAEAAVPSGGRRGGGSTARGGGGGPGGPVHGRAPAGRGRHHL